MFDEEIGTYVFPSKKISYRTDPIKEEETYTSNTSYDIPPGTMLTMEHIRKAFDKMMEDAIIYGTDRKPQKATLPSKPRLLDKDGKLIREV
jgi:hypothetical protein